MSKRAPGDRTASTTPPSNGPTPSASTSSLPSSPEELAEKELIEEYLAQHGIENALNVFLNQVVRDRPADPYLVLGGLLQHRATSSKGIFSISAREVFDANGLPTLLAVVHTSKGRFEGSTSSHTPAIYDTDDVTRCRGKGIRARDLALYVQHLLEGVDPCEQAVCDEKIASMEEKLGRQACLALSIAICKAGAVHKDVPLFEHIATLADVPIENACVPVPILSVAHGGLQGSNKLFVQEITVMPIGCVSFHDAMRWGAELNLVLRDLLDAKGLGHVNRGAVGGFAPQLNSTEEAIVIVKDAIAKVKEVHPSSGISFGLGVHVAAHAFATVGVDGDVVYNLDKWVAGSKGLNKGGDEVVDILREWCRQHQVMTIIDPVDIKDIKIASTLNRSENEAVDAGNSDAADGVGGDPSVKVQVVGHAFLQHTKLETLHEERACNTILLHLSQYGTVTAAVQAVVQARVLGLSVIVGCDAGTVDDVFPVDFAVGIGCGQIKMGGLLSAEGVVRYNRLAGLSTDDPRAPSYAGATFRR
ncbi:hypothetical protein H310_07045 [Aphanomyces invadans]|uniref:phosphopyruvate hydratase n=1 Tax=Aphanomyces invadans TaxID=157072 RepID=A0A024U1Y3_9STRA|nr:hypothetical protein H310_07045 [Aphanomyces invadans]ETW00406.1 hypothetical protein H310_07045 [Aphanomyces invadans]|eukprot:XP_008870541.1 hypothetical protein H310_07045 [Aphanomyces invadans]